jgi:hypothetical protein
MAIYIYTMSTYHVLPCPHLIPCPTASMSTLTSCLACTVRLQRAYVRTCTLQIVTSHHHTCLHYPDCFHVSCMSTFLIYRHYYLSIYMYQAWSQWWHRHSTTTHSTVSCQHPRDLLLLLLDRISSVMFVGLTHVRTVRFRGNSNQECDC